MDTQADTLPADVAQACLAAVEAQYAHYLVDIDGTDPRDRPILLEPGHPNNDSTNGGWMILWECGPDEWAYRTPGGGVDEELLQLAREAGADQRSAAEIATDPPMVAWPTAQVFAEPYASYALALYPAWDAA